MVAATSPPFVSNGFGVTVKLLADNGPILEHEVNANTEQTDKIKMRFLRIVIIFCFSVPRAGLEPAQPLLAKGF